MMRLILLAGVALGSFAFVRLPRVCRGDDEQVSQNPDAATSRPATAFVTYHVLGMKKTKSGAT